jgi:hypothetical protein
MRQKLAKHEGERKKFFATVSKTGKRVSIKGYSEDTLLLLQVTDAETNQVVCDHVWFAYSKTFDDARLSPGLKISFEARVKEYSKGYVNRSLGINNRKRDYKLSHPTKVTVIHG